MSPLPETRKSPEELAALKQQPARAREQQRVGFEDLTNAPHSVIPVGEWLLTLIVLTIPILNIVLYIYWAFISKGNQNRINFCRASLILALLGLLLFAILKHG